MIRKTPMLPPLKIKMAKDSKDAIEKMDHT